MLPEAFHIPGWIERDEHLISVAIAGEGESNSSDILLRSIQLRRGERVSGM